MTDHQHRHPEPATEDEVFLAEVGPSLRTALRNPFVLGFLAVAAAALLFRFGITIGEVVYLAFEGDGATAAAFGGTFIAILIALVAIGAWLDRRRGTRSRAATPLTTEQRRRVEAYLHPTSMLARWYRVVVLVVFAALAIPGTMLLPTPWDGVWLVSVLAANPVGRWLRSQGHVLTTRDLGVEVPGLSPWPSIAVTALAATAGVAIAILLWAELLDGTVETLVTGTLAVTAILVGGAVTDRHERSHLARVLEDQTP
jgi:hypothetical protein